MVHSTALAEAPERAWPVVLDPTVYRPSSPECLIDQAQPTTNLCALDYISAGSSTTESSNQTRSVLKFDVQGSIPADAEILQGTMIMRLRAQQTTTPKTVFAHPLTRDFSGATWNNATSSTAWTSPGGDFASSPAPESNPTVGGTGAVGNRVSWDLKDVTQRWFDGRLQNKGILLKTDGGTQNGFQFGEVAGDGDPFMDIAYTRRLGEQRGFAMQRQPLSDRLKLAVNSYHGNLVVSATDLAIPGGIGLDLSVGRTYDSLASALAYNTRPELGSRWAMTTAGGVRLDRDDTEAGALRRRDYKAPNGGHYQFVEQSTAGGVRTYKTPKGLDATVTETTSDNKPTLTEHESQTKWRFDAVGRAASVEDRNGRKITFAYGANGLSSITDSQNRATTFTTTTGGRVSKMTDPAGRDTTYGYTGDLLTSVTDSAGKTSSFEYAGEQLTKITTPGGRVTEIEYFPTSDPANAGRVKKLTRKTASLIDTDPAWTFAYTVRRDATTATPSTSTVTDPNNRTTTYEFGPDAAGRPDARPTKVTDATGRSVKNGYTANANVETYQAPTNTGTTPSTTFQFDSDGNQTGSTTMAAGGDLETKNTYGATRSGGSVQGGTYLPTLVQNEQDTASGSTTQGTGIEYDNAEGNPTLIKNTSSVTAQVSMSYGTGADGKPGRLNSTTDPRGNATNYTYDATGNLTKIDHPAVTPSGATQPGDELFTYTGAAGDDQAMSRITRYTDGRGNTVDYLYDDRDRLLKLTYKNPSAVEEARHEYAYDNDGNLVQRQDIEGGSTKTYSFAYDDLGRLTTETRPGLLDSTTYTYDGVGNLTSLADIGGTVTYTYDQINRLATVQEPGASTAVDVDDLDTTGDADPNTVDHGRKVVTANPNGVTTTEISDPAGRLLRTESVKSGTVLQRFLYEYQHGTGSTTKQTTLRSKETDKDGNTTTYNYDAGLDRLVQAQTKTSGGTTTKTYGYELDAAGNLTKRVEDTGTPTVYQHNEANQLCWSVTANLGSRPGCATPPTGATTHAYDAQGNETARTAGASATHQFTYNARNQLTYALTPLAAAIKTYAGPGNERRTTNGSTSSHDDALGLASTNPGSPTYFTRGDAGQDISQRTPSASAPVRRHYPLTDALGSIRALTDENGTVVRRYSYDPYGRDAGTTGSGAQSRLRYAGGELDGQGLYHFGARYYDPSIGRWNQRDPLNQSADLREGNRYGYVGGDPINGIDPGGCKRELGKFIRCVGQNGCNARRLVPCTFRPLPSMIIQCIAIQCGFAASKCSQYLS